MKKFTSVGIAALVCLLWVAPLSAQDTDPTPPPSASTEIFDYSLLKDKVILNLFKDALDQGRMYPTPAEFEAAGFNYLDIEFVRSHTRLRPAMIEKNKQLNPELYEKRQLFMNIPMGVGKILGGYPSSEFRNDVFSMWNYTKLFGSWNHSLFQAPGVWIDAAHKNGTDIMSGIKFFESWTPGSGAGEYADLITTKNEDGSFTYAEPLINCLMFFGSDGINYNWEDNSYDNEDVVAFHKTLYKLAAEKGFDNFHIAIYTSSAILNARNVEALFGTTETGKTTDLMLNYAGGDFSYNMGSSVQTAESNMGTADGLYAGVWIVTMDRSWSRLNADEDSKRCGICLWGEHDQSRFMSYNMGNDAMEFQSNYQKLLERTFSGGNRNPQNLPPINDEGNNWTKEGDKEPLSTFCGLATFVPERTAIQGDLPFTTYFNLGNGERYNYKGKKTFGSWYNMGNQDIVPTYRWLVYNADTKNVSSDIQPEFTNEDAYMGGAALRLFGNAVSAGTDVVLYRAKLHVAHGEPKVKIAVKQGTPVQGTQASGLSVILKKLDNDQWYEIPVGDTQGPEWQEKELPMTGFGTGDVIEYIGLRVKGSSPVYNMLVGKLELSDNRIAAPAPIKTGSLVAEVKEETTRSLSLKLNWAVDGTGLNAARADYGLIYNDEANIDHFEIMYKNGADGKISEIARSSSWTGFTGNIKFEGHDDEPYIGVRAASIDMKTYSPVEWLKIERSDSPNLPVYKDLLYCESYMPSTSAGADVARERRFLTLFKTEGADQNINYSTQTQPQPDGSQYYDATDNVMKVSQGQTITLTFRAYDTTPLDKQNGLRSCFGKAYMDFDQSHSFEPNGDEMLFNLGTFEAQTPAFETQDNTITYTIPADAAVGPSRLRIVFSDAWMPHPGPCGETVKGFSIDFGVEITGNNPSRPVAPDFHDQGEADEPDRVRDDNPNNPPQSIETAQAYAGFSTCYPSPADNVIFFNDVEKAWVYTLNGQLVKFATGNPQSLDVSDLSSGMYIVKMQYNNVIRSQKLYKK
ncbi:endo-beta-N-acetylglucosaminidase [Coprobacter tertius]|uniref:T9SS type A sorting domain-containing protein n=1 Tax=Coprobacter tertius TaxID=2944915 RepID=A0ABT1MJH3_9BACT|nr:T9SS type A sorting domain-containing protein [Coprobacter tertius]MCP9612782.1 T9SS type A sorting domain-containing protein [Coprobacter tertius]